MNVYDFDGTILKGDSERYYFDYIFKHYPKSRKHRLVFWFRNILQKWHLLSDQKAASYAYSSVLKYIGDVDKFLEKFWDEHKVYIKDWYKKAHKEDDVVISGTPGFILEPIMKRLHINYLIASNVEKSTGIITEKLCLEAEKVVRFKELYRIEDIDLFYTDADKDIYMARIAKKAYKVIDDKIIEWNVKDGK